MNDSGEANRATADGWRTFATLDKLVRTIRAETDIARRILRRTDKGIEQSTGALTGYGDAGRGVLLC